MHLGFGLDAPSADALVAILEERRATLRRLDTHHTITLSVTVPGMKPKLAYFSDAAAGSSCSARAFTSPIVPLIASLTLTLWPALMLLECYTHRSAIPIIKLATIQGVRASAQAHAPRAALVSSAKKKRQGNERRRARRLRRVSARGGPNRPRPECRPVPGWRDGRVRLRRRAARAECARPVVGRNVHARRDGGGLRRCRRQLLWRLHARRRAARSGHGGVRARCCRRHGDDEHARSILKNFALTEGSPPWAGSRRYPAKWAHSGVLRGAPPAARGGLGRDLEAGLK